MSNSKWLTVSHVMNVREDKDAPLWSTLLAKPASDVYYDGPLVGLPVVCFSVSRLRGGRHPTFSPYPTRGTVGDGYWRVKTELPLSKSRVFLMHERTSESGVTQVQLLLLSRSESDRTHVYLSAVLRLIGFEELHGPDFGGFLPFWQPNEYDSHSNDRTWVNCHCLGDVALHGDASQWDVITKADFGAGRLVSQRNFKRVEDAVLDWVDTYETTDAYCAHVIVCAVACVCRCGADRVRKLFEIKRCGR